MLEISEHGGRLFFPSRYIFPKHVPREASLFITVLRWKQKHFHRKTVIWI